ncbi:MAG: TonB-dependent receptor, partial [Nitrospinota bacterium]|nr:TonB-dependent receptor [Nitrospinota bacterium]
SLNQHQAPNETTFTVVCEHGTCQVQFHHSRWRWQSDPTAEWEEERFFQAQIGSTVNRRRRARSLYAQEQLTLRRNLTLTAGVRFDDFDVGEDPLTTKFSAAYRIRGAGTKIRGVVGEGVKRPSFSDLFGISTFTGNPNLKSEKQENWEMGVDQDLLGGKMKWTATYFETYLKNLIAFSFGGFPNGMSFENISKVRLKGAEFSAALIDLEYFTLRVSYNTLDTVVLDDRDGAGGSSFVQGRELLRRPNWWWSGSVLYHPDRLSAGVFVNQVGDRRDGDFRPFVDGSNGGAARTVNNPGFTKIDLALAYDLIPERGPAARKGGWLQARRLTAEFRANNILDEDYDEVFGFNAPGISLYAGFRLRF